MPGSIARMAYDDPGRTRTLDELDGWAFPGTALAVLGQPIAHSVSPAMHNAALNLMAQTQFAFQHWRYFKFEVAPEALPEALERFHAAGFHGLNLTLPHKVQAVDLVREIDPEARHAGAVNTLSRRDDGWAGSNTDGHGLEQALRRGLGVALHGATVVLLGAGGAARGAAVRCLQSGCAQLWIGNRNQDRLATLVSGLSALPGGKRVQGFDLAAPPATLPPDAVVINATSLGLKANDPAPITLDRFGPGTCIYDMTYGVDNALTRAARERGLPVADGLGMLVGQGARSLEIWSGTDVPAQAMMDGACHAKGWTPRPA